jgi:hypothetical protein
LETENRGFGEENWEILIPLKAGPKCDDIWKFTHYFLGLSKNIFSRAEFFNQ